MNATLIVFGLLASIVVYMLKAVLEREYWWIARNIGRLMIRGAAVLHPREGRRERVAEWLAELDAAADQQVTAIAFAGGIFLAASTERLRYLRGKLMNRTFRRETKPPSKRRAINSDELLRWFQLAENIGYDELTREATAQGWTVSHTAGTQMVLLSRSDDTGRTVIQLPYAREPRGDTKDMEA